MTEVLERAWTSRVRAVVHAPPRHAKTDTTSHWVAQTLLKFPAARIGYATYAAELSLSKSKEMHEVAERSGVKLGGIQRLSEWQTTEGGGVFAAGVGGGFTGRGFNFLLIDDPFKNRVEAESALIRERVHSWYKSTARTRLQPGGSVVVLMTRWHEDDLSGRLLKSGKFEDVCLPAIGADGRALWPEQYSLQELEETRDEVQAYDWASLYQGKPIPVGGRVFKDAVSYDAIPEAPFGFRESIGADLAYAARTKADWSVYVVLRRIGEVFYVLEVKRVQCSAPEFKAMLADVQRRHPRASCRWYAYGAEKGVGDFMASGEGKRIRLEVISAPGDKLIRSHPVASAWNRGKVLVPNESAWGDAFVSELASFTGVGDVHDDQVDALAAAYDLIALGSNVDRIRALGRA